MAVDSPDNPTVLSVRLKASKTDPFQKGITLYIGRVSSDLCPVSAILAYLSSRGKKNGPLFLFTDGRPLTRQLFVTAVRDALRRVEVNAGCYAGHSFRIGAATTAAARGLEDSTIQTLGRWKSLAYLEYIRIPLLGEAVLTVPADSVHPVMVVLWSHPCISILCLLSLGLVGPPFLRVGCCRMSCSPLAELKGFSPPH